MEKGKEKGASRGNADAERIWAKPPLEVFLEDGRAGLKNRDGEVVLVPVWGQVEIRGECVAARDNGFEDRFWRDGRSGSTILSEDNHFYRNGKVGLLKDGKVWFDAVYDEIDDWSEAGFDVVYTRIGQTPAYFTGDHRPVLTQWRRFPDLQGEEEPYYVWEKQHSPVLVTMVRGGGPDDAQSCRLKDGFVHLDRMRKSEVLPMFSAGSQVRKENAHRLAEFECAFTYIYSAYAARAKGPDAVEECFKDFAWMDCFESSWARLILVSVSPGRKAPLDVRVLVRGSAAVPEWEPTGDFAVGFDESLEEDEVRVFMVQYFADHWPSQMEFHVGYELDSYVPARVRAAADEWRRYVEDAENFTSEEGQAAYRLEASRPLEPSPVVPAGRSWKSIERVCRMLLDGGATLRRFASEICRRCIYLDESEIAPIFGNQVRLLEWALAHGSNPDEVDWDGTCLDALESHLAWLESRPKEKALSESLALTRGIAGADSRCRRKTTSRVAGRLGAGVAVEAKTNGMRNIPMPEEEEFKWLANRPIDEALFHACSTESRAEVLSLLDRGADPNAPYYYPDATIPELDAHYCIYEAAMNKDIRVFDLLVERGANPRQPNVWGHQPLDFAVIANSLEMVKHLVELGNDPKGWDLDGGSVMSRAALNPDVRVPEFLLAHGAELDGGSIDQSELGQAVQDGTPERVRFFLEHGSNPQIPEMSIPRAPLENLRILLEAGFDPDAFTGDCWIDGKQEGSPHRLFEDLDPERQALFEEFGSKKSKAKGKGMVKVLIVSFSYMQGVPEDETGHGGGFVFDCRCLPNPFWDEELRRFSGKDEPIREFFAEHRKEVEAFAGAAEALVRQTIRVFQSDGRRHLMVAFGCTGGQHRSVFMAEELARRLHGMPGVEIVVKHMRAGDWGTKPKT